MSWVVTLDGAVKIRVVVAAAAMPLTLVRGVPMVVRAAGVVRSVDA